MRVRRGGEVASGLHRGTRRGLCFACRCASGALSSARRMRILPAAWRDMVGYMIGLARVDGLALYERMLT